MTLQARPARLSTADASFDADFKARLHWSAEADAAIEERVAAILADVQLRGDAAVLDYTQRFDGLTAASVQALELTQAELKAAFEGVGHGDENQWDDGDRQHDVGEKHPVVKGAPEAFAAEGGVDSLNEVFVEDIGGEENAGGEKRPEHAVAVGDFAFGFDTNETGEEEDRGDAVESGVEGRQIGDAHCGEFWRSSFRQVSTM